jgi:hypothetical protein
MKKLLLTYYNSLALTRKSFSSQFIFKQMGKVQIFQQVISCSTLSMSGRCIPAAARRRTVSAPIPCAAHNLGSVWSGEVYYKSISLLRGEAYNKAKYLFGCMDF